MVVQEVHTAAGHNTCLLCVYMHVHAHVSPASNINDFVHNTLHEPASIQSWQATHWCLKSRGTPLVKLVRHIGTAPKNRDWFGCRNR